MSNFTAIAAVTDALRQRLKLVLDAEIGANIEVSTMTPDRAEDVSDTEFQVNLFLYLVTPSPAWRNQPMPSPVNTGSLNTRPPLALTLSYLLTVFKPTNNDVVAHLLLGSAMRVLHDTAVLDRELIGNAVVGNTGGLGLTEAVDLHRQIDRVSIVPETMTVDDMSKLWTTFQAKYRISAAFQANVVLIESKQTIPAALPVLSRGRQDQGVHTQVGMPPVLLGTRLYRIEDTVSIRVSKPAAEYGDQIAFVVDQLPPGDADAALRFTYSATGETIYIDAPFITASVEFEGKRAYELRLNAPLSSLLLRTPPAVPPDPDDPLHPRWRAGIYLVSLTLTTYDADDLPLPVMTSNALPFALAPRIIDRAPANVPAGAFLLDVACTPRVRDDARAVLVFGQNEYAISSIADPGADPETSVLTFEILDSAPSADGYPLRLRIDGVDSLPIDFTAQPPSFDADQKVIVT